MRPMMRIEEAVAYLRDGCLLLEEHKALHDLMRRRIADMRSHTSGLTGRDLPAIEIEKNKVRERCLELCPIRRNSTRAASSVSGISSGARRLEVAPQSRSNAKSCAGGPSGFAVRWKPIFAKAS